MGANHRRATMVDDVLEIVGEKPIVDWYQDRSELRDRVVRLQVRMRVRGNVGDPIAAADSGSFFHAETHLRIRVMLRWAFFALPAQMRQCRRSIQTQNGTWRTRTALAVRC